MATDAKIWRESGFVENDPWVIESDEVKAEEDQKVLLPLAALIEKAEESNDVGLGVVLYPADDVVKLEPYLSRIEIVAVSFPAFSDGRAFSQSSLLRDRLAFKGEVRAVGDVLIDQVPLMLRVGIDTFSVTNATAVRRLSEGRLPGISEHYQPAVKAADAGQGYSWRRRALTAEQA